MPAIQSCFIEPLSGTSSPFSCRPGRGATRWAATAPGSPTASSSTSSSTTLRRRRDEWIGLGVMDQLAQIAEELRPAHRFAAR